MFNCWLSYFVGNVFFLSFVVVKQGNMCRPMSRIYWAFCQALTAIELLLSSMMCETLGHCLRRHWLWSYRFVDFAWKILVNFGEWSKWSIQPCFRFRSRFLCRSSIAMKCLFENSRLNDVGSTIQALFQNKHCFAKVRTKYICWRWWFSVRAYFVAVLLISKRCKRPEHLLT